MTDLASQLAQDGGPADLMGRAYAAKAYPCLDTLTPAEVYSLGFRDGARAGLAVLPALRAGILDDAETIALLCSPDVLPLPDLPPAADPAQA